VTTRPHSSFSIVFILGLLAMLMPLSIDMYLPALPVISAQFGVPAGSAQMTLSTYILGFAVGQLLYGPMADSLGRKPVILGALKRWRRRNVAAASTTIITVSTSRKTLIARCRKPSRRRQSARWISLPARRHP
jgi:DHA1 family bicyclomycin/chloramphenicol resistance-like MFS transporter